MSTSAPDYVPNLGTNPEPRNYSSTVAPSLDKDYNYPQFSETHERQQGKSQQAQYINFESNLESLSENENDETLQDLNIQSVKNFHNLEHTKNEHHHRHHHKKRKRRRSRHLGSDESDVDSLTEQMEQIGKLNLNLSLNLSSYITKDSFNLPNMPNFSNLPNLPNLPTFELSRIQEFPKEFSRYVSSYVNASRITTSSNAVDTGKSDRSGGDPAVAEDKSHEQQRLANSIKTVVSTRIQMNKFLSDLRLGVNISTAIDRLQPLTDIIHETIFLPAEDISDFEDDYQVGQSRNEASEEITEPVGVGEIVNKDQPLLYDIVKPESASASHKRRSRRRQISESIDDSGTQTSDLDNIEGLTIDQVRQLTDLDSLDDFSKEVLLRNRIQHIQNLDSISQSAKNKLVTRLMMGNYYKYVSEKLSKENKSELKLPSLLRKQKLVLHELDHNDGESTIVEDFVIPEVEESSVAQDVEENIEAKVVASPMDVSMGEEVNKEDEEDDEDESDGEEVILTEQDQEPSYHNPPFNTIMGCQHYHRKCKLECPTCLKWFPCRFCHDSEVTSHKLIRSEVRHILCMKCNAPQVPESNQCVNCETELAYYFCSKCVLYDNDHTKDIYHCDKCGICRLGLGIGKDYFHCDECNICLSIDLREKHKCLNNTTHCDCPICNEYLFTSVNKVVFMKCGHSIHQHCYDEMVKHSYKCPICKKTIVNVETQFRLLDQEISQSPLPAPYNSWRCIISCNDCKGKSNAPYHVLGLKCKYCKSYNTNQLKLVKPEEDDDDIDDDNETQRTEHFDSDLMRLARTNLSSNFRIDEHSIHEDEISGYEDEGEDGEADDEKENDNLSQMRKLTAIGRNNENPYRSNVSYITSIFQNFINSATSKKFDDAEETRSARSIGIVTEGQNMSVDDDKESDLGEVGGF